MFSITRPLTHWACWELLWPRVSAWELQRHGLQPQQASCGPWTQAVMVTALSCFQRTRSHSTRSCTTTSPPRRWVCTTSSAASGRRWTSTAQSPGDTGNPGQLPELHRCSSSALTSKHSQAVQVIISQTCVITMCGSSGRPGPGRFRHVAWLRWLAVLFRKMLITTVLFPQRFCEN